MGYINEGQFCNLLKILFLSSYLKPTVQLEKKREETF